MDIAYVGFNRNQLAQSSTAACSSRCRGAGHRSKTTSELSFGCSKFPSIGSHNCDSGLWSQNSHSRGHESRCVHGVCILSRQSADSDSSHRVRPVTHLPNIRVCTTKEELAGATRLASLSTHSLPLHPSHVPTESLSRSHTLCEGVRAASSVIFGVLVDLWWGEKATEHTGHRQRLRRRFLMTSSKPGSIQRHPQRL